MVITMIIFLCSLLATSKEGDDISQGSVLWSRLIVEEGQFREDPPWETLNPKPSEVQGLGWEATSLDSELPITISKK